MYIQWRARHAAKQFEQHPVAGDQDHYDTEPDPDKEQLEHLDPQLQTLRWFENGGGSQANVSKHLSVLKRAGLVDCRREGLNVYYRIVDEGVFTICRNVCDSLELRIESEHEAIIQGRRQIEDAEIVKT